MKTNVYIGVGSNISPKENIKKALIAIKTHVEVVKTSTFYITKPLYRHNQDNYLNGAWLITTDIAPEIIKVEVLEKIEKKLKRERSQDKYAPRTIDLDIILYGNKVIKNSVLTIPDPDLYKRFFLIKPILELEPDIILPDSLTPLKNIKIKLPTDSVKPDMEFTLELKKIIEQK